MSVLRELVRNVVVIILVTTFLEMLLPSGSMKRYVKVVLGVFILLTVLAPLSRFLKSGEELAVFGWSAPEARGSVSVLEDGNRLSQVNRDLLKNNYAKGLEQQVVALVKLVQGVVAAEATVDLQVASDGNLQGINLVSVKVSISEAETVGKVEQQDSSLVEPIKIEVSLGGEGKKGTGLEKGLSQAESSVRQAANEREKKIEREIKETIAQFLGLKLEQILVTFW